MVDRILGKLDEIVTSTKSGIHISSHAEDRQILKDAFDTIIKKPSDIPFQVRKIPTPSHYQPGAPSKTIPRRPVILSDDQQEDVRLPPEGVISSKSREYPSRSTTLLRDELKEALKQPGYKPRGLSKERPEHKVIQPYVEQEVIPESVENQPPVLPEEREQPVPQTSVEPTGIPITPDVQTRVESKRIPTRKEGQYRAPSKKELTPMENKLVVDSIRKLQKDILRDLDMFGLTPDSFRKPGKDIQNVKIPKKADVNKKLASAKEEITDLDWLYE
jgi:hypothetical protein